MSIPPESNPGAFDPTRGLAEATRRLTEEARQQAEYRRQEEEYQRDLERRRAARVQEQAELERTLELQRQQAAVEAERLEIARELLDNQAKLREVTGPAPGAAWRGRQELRHAFETDDFSTLPPELAGHLTEEAGRRVLTNTDAASVREAEAAIRRGEAPPGAGGPPPPGPPGGTNAQGPPSPDETPGGMGLGDLIGELGRGNLGAPIAYGQDLLRRGLGSDNAGIKWGSRIALGLGAAAGLPFTLERAGRALGGVYQHAAGSDIATGLGAGFTGEASDAGTLATGLLNRLATPFQAVFGAPFFGGSAQEFGARRRVEALREGFSPFDMLSVSQAQSIQEEVLGRGYRADSQVEEQVRHGLYDLARDYPNVDTGVALDYLDIVVKQLGGDTQEFIEVLKDFGPAARAAGKSQEEYTREVAEVSKEMLQAGASLETIRETAQGLAGFQNITADQLRQSINDPAARGILLHVAAQRDPSLLTDPARALAFQLDPTNTLGADAVATQVATIRRLARMVTDAMPYLAGPGQEGVLAEFLAQRFPVGGLTAQQIQEILTQGDTVVNDARRQAEVANLTTDIDTIIEGRYLSGQIPETLFNLGRREKAEQEGRLEATPFERRLLLDDPRTGGRFRRAYNQLLETLDRDPNLTDEDIEEFRTRLFKGESPQDVSADATSRGAGRRQDQTITTKLDLTERAAEVFRILNIDPNVLKVSPATLREQAERNKQRSAIDHVRARWGIP